ncbi:hypothetical protein AK812_SmicGene39128 [Symbiodinium microadriaticum]|uniref:DUF4326 domain-containing protein n=1 Tax=Symbiodinium microadriaticum TaxID=2951 RepID=A0A1Q9CCB2_SYMMI|nr:hypothetical protein AK812_SmicGene39128 [Symbiodinium microadriaticum]CAE7365568.1 unnamed protein product [Symbiodinium microadriaticum]
MELLRAELAQARRRQKAAEAKLRALEDEASELRKLESAKKAGTTSAQDVEVPLVSAAGLLQRCALSSEAVSLPCELWPYVYSSIARAAVPEAVVAKLQEQFEAAMRSGSKHGSTRRVPLQRLDRDFQACLFDLCRILAAALRGSRDVSLELDQVWGVAQQQGDYSPVTAHRNLKSRHGFSCIMDILLPPSLSCENHERPSKGSYGFHDGLHNLIWKGDRTTDKDDLVQPGIIQLELRVGQLYVFPDWVQTLTYPFEGSGERRWIVATGSRMKRPSAVDGATAKLSSIKSSKSRKADEDGSQAVAVSVKVAELRSAGYVDFETWLKGSRNVYVGRRGRIFIHNDGGKRIFHYPGSKWQNPYAVGASFSRQDACSKYRSALLDGTLKDPQDGAPLHTKLRELKGLRSPSFKRKVLCMLQNLQINLAAAGGPTQSRIIDRDAIQM